MQCFFRRFDGRAIVRVQDTIALDAFSEAQPDFTLLTAPAERYRRRLPEAADVCS